MPVLNLTNEAAKIAIDPASLDLTSLDESGRQAAIATWRGRMVNEHISARVFAALIPQMMRAEIDGARQAAVAEMIADELRHARQCAAVVIAFGCESVWEDPEITSVRVIVDV